MYQQVPRISGNSPANHSGYTHLHAAPPESCVQRGDARGVITMRPTKRGAYALNVLGFIAAIILIAVLLAYTPSNTFNHVMRAYLLWYALNAANKAYNHQLFVVKG